MLRPFFPELVMATDLLSFEHPSVPLFSSSHFPLLYTCNICSHYLLLYNICSHNLLLLTWIYFCQSGGTVNFILPFMTNLTISISTSQIFRSWVSIFQPRSPMASLFRSLYGMPGLAPRMDVLSWGRRDFQISFSNRDTSRNAWNRHWDSFMVDTGILSNNMKFPSPKC